MVRVRVLGELALEIDGRRTEPPAGRPARALLGWLALHPGAHARGDVAARLWPEVLDTSARTSLRSALVRVTRALGPGAAVALIATRDEVGLRPGPALAIDAAELEGLIAAGELESAWALGQDEVLRGLDDDWVLLARDEHAARVATLLEDLAAQAEAAGHLDAAADWTRRLVERDPLSEDAARRLMSRLAAAGDGGAALAAYARLAGRLAAAVGAPPSAPTRDLADRLRATGAPAPADARPRAHAPLPLPALVAVRDRLPFVGRGRELACIESAWDGAAAGNAQRVLALAGHPGIGKTSLVATVARRLHARGAQVLLGRCELDSAGPYGPFAEVLAQLVAGLAPERLARWPGLGAGELVRIMPGLAAQVWDLPPVLTGDPDGARHRLFLAIDGVLADAAATAPTLLVIEDAHWADEPTLRLLAHVARSPRQAPLHLLLTYRRAELATNRGLAELLIDLDRDGLLERVVLEGLDEAELADLVTAATGAPPPSGFAAALQRHTDGNPFFAREVLRNWPGPLPADAAEDEWLAAIREHGVPAGVRDIIGRRLRQLPPASLGVLELAAVLGRDVDTTLLREVAGMDPNDLRDALREPLAARIVVLPADRPGRLEFHHDLVREVLHAGVAMLDREAVHRHAAQLLEGSSATGAPAPFGEIARHLARAGLPEAARAADYAERAGDEALRALAYEDAASWFEEARARFPMDGRSATELDLRCGDAHARAGDLVAARDAFARAAGAARAIDAPDLLARAALGFAGRALTRFGTPGEEELALLEEALAAVGDGHDALRAQLLARLAHARYLGAPQESARMGSAALAAARTAGDASALASALEARVFAAWIPGGADQRRHAASELVEVALAAGALDRLAEGLNWRLTAALELGDVGAADRDIARYCALAARLRVPQLENYAGVHRALRALLDGRLAEAETFSLAALRAAPDDGGTDDAAQNFALQHFTLRDEQGRLGELAEQLEAVVNRYAAIPAWRFSRAWTWCRSGRRSDAAAELTALAAGDFGLLPRDANWLPSFVLGARLCDALGDAGAAEVVHRLVLPFADLHMVAGYAVHWGPVQHTLGVAAHAAGRHHDAGEHFALALAEEERIGAPAQAAHTRAAWAAARARRGGRGDAAAARALRSQAAAAGRELGLTALLADLEAVA